MGTGVEAGIGKVELSEVRYHVFVVFPQWLPVNSVHTLKRNLCFNIFMILSVFTCLYAYV